MDETYIISPGDFERKVSSAVSHCEYVDAFAIRDYCISLMGYILRQQGYGRGVDAFERAFGTPKYNNPYVF